MSEFLDITTEPVNEEFCLIHPIRPCLLGDISRAETAEGILGHPVGSRVYQWAMSNFDADAEYDIPVIDRILEYETREESRAILLEKRKWVIENSGEQGKLL